MKVSKSPLGIRASFEEDKISSMVPPVGKQRFMCDLFKKCWSRQTVRLYLLPEIALTTQLISRLQYFQASSVIHHLSTFESMSGSLSLVLEPKELM
jgi:primosomal protein N'